MVGNGKKKALRDVLGELDKSEKTKTNFASNTFSSEDITGLESKIPIVTDGLISFNDDPDLDNIEIPIPQEITFEEEKKQKPEPIKEEPVRAPSFKVDSNSSINSLEELQQRAANLEEDNKKQRQLLIAQKKELEEYMARLGEAEADNKKLRGELSNADSNARMNLEAQLNRASIIEEKYNKLAHNHEEMKTKVRNDIRKIRVREKELANKLEIMRNDSETLLTAKDQKILQLKQHIDNLEFEIETLKEKLVSMQELAKDSEDKAERVIKALRLSTSLLEINPKKE